MNSHIALVSSMAGSANPWVYTDRYKRPRCICTLLNNGLSTFPAYLMSTGCIQFPCSFLLFMPILLNFALFITGCWLLVGSSFIVLGLLWYFWTVLGNMSHFSVIIAHQSLWVGLCFVYYSFILMLEISGRAWMVVAFETHTVCFLPTSVRLSWLCLGTHQSSLTLVPL